VNYLDTSALIKRFVAEKGSSLVRILVERHGPVATSKLAYAEVYSGLSRKKREGLLSRAQYTLACRQFEMEWSAYIRVDLSDEILFLARDLIQRHPLKGFDAIHLATALELKEALGQQIAFAGADERQLQAAALENLTTLNVESAESLPSD